MLFAQQREGVREFADRRSAVAASELGSRNGRALPGCVRGIPGTREAFDSKPGLSLGFGWIAQVESCVGQISVNDGHERIGTIRFQKFQRPLEFLLRQS